MFISRFSILFYHFICNPYASITYVYTLMPLSHSFTYCRFVISLEMEKKMSFHDFVALFQDYFGHSGSYTIPQELEDRLFHLWKKKKKATGILIKSPLNL